MPAGFVPDVASRRLVAHVRRRCWPVAVTMVSLLTGMAYCLLWGPIVRHTQVWVVPWDIWGAFRSAHYIGWGDLGGVYSANTGLVTFPGILLLFAPMALLSGAFHMTESFPFILPHPTAWLVLGPMEILVSCVALFACDAVAERLGAGRRRRALLCLVEGAVLWNVSVIWGHPEDALAVALALYALVFAFDDRWSATGWLLGAAMATQPLVVLMLPVFLALAGRRRALALLVRASLPSVLLLAAPLAAEFHVTIRALVDQPNYPNVDHRTPWTSLAPALGGHGQGLEVAAGPGRIVALVLAGAVGWWSRRWRDRPELIVLAVAFALALRCLTESVMVSFYVWPVLAVGLVAVTRGSSWRWVTAVGVALAITVCSNSHLGQWAWWGLVSGGIVVLLALGIPSRRQRSVPITPSAADVAPVHDHPPALVGARP